MSKPYLPNFSLKKLINEEATRSKKNVPQKKSINPEHLSIELNRLNRRIKSIKKEVFQINESVPNHTKHTLDAINKYISIISSEKIPSIDSQSIQDLYETSESFLETQMDYILEKSKDEVLEAVDIPDKNLMISKEQFDLKEESDDIIEQKIHFLSYRFQNRTKRVHSIIDSIEKKAAQFETETKAQDSEASNTINELILENNRKVFELQAKVSRVSSQLYKLSSLKEQLENKSKNKDLKNTRAIFFDHTRQIEYLNNRVSQISTHYSSICESLKKSITSQIDSLNNISDSIQNLKAISGNIIDRLEESNVTTSNSIHTITQLLDINPYLEYRAGATKQSRLINDDISKLQVSFDQLSKRIDKAERIIISTNKPM